MSEPQDAEVETRAVTVRADDLDESRIKATVTTLQTIRKFVASQLKDGTDYGVIPGTGSKDRPAKKTLLQPGAQKIVMLYNAYPKAIVEAREQGGGHVEYVVTTELISRTSGEVIGYGVGSCSTMESKYRYRGGSRICPECGASAIIKGKAEFGGGWLCWAKKNGCGYKFADGDQAIEGQSIEKIENPDIADARNTVLKMATKRSLVSAAHALGCVADEFTQDMEDEVRDEPAPKANGRPAQRQEPQQEKEQPKPDETRVAAAKAWLESDPPLAEFNERWGKLWAATGPTGKAIVELCRKHAAGLGIVEDSGHVWSRPNSPTQTVEGKTEIPW